MTEAEAREVRARVEYEDSVLNARTNIVLTLNGLFAIAVGLSLPPGPKICATGIIIVLDLLWVNCALDALHLIKTLTGKLAESGATPKHEVLRYEAQRGRFRLPPTIFLSVIVPIMLAGGWVVGLILALLSP